MVGRGSGHRSTIEECQNASRAEWSQAHLFSPAMLRPFSSTANDQRRKGNFPLLQGLNNWYFPAVVHHTSSSHMISDARYPLSAVAWDRKNLAMFVRSFNYALSGIHGVHRINRVRLPGEIKQICSDCEDQVVSAGPGPAKEASEPSHSHPGNPHTQSSIPCRVLWVGPVVKASVTTTSYLKLEKMTTIF
ncbi:hypothetical protein BGZ60DRAFT_128799 [Tricladium varicosporioides]|nr:hypothetical protein BGZ60DRAFT_128799 [Hymenoscyphus varicosporioides]